MKVEVVEFYPFNPSPKQPDVIHGTMHVYICDLQMDVRGIYWFKKRNSPIWRMKIPHHKILDENGKIGFYPIINFIDKVKQSSFSNGILNEGRKYLKEFYKR